MKKLKPTLLILLLSISFFCKAQEKNNIIKTSLLWPFTNSFLVGYERMVGAESSIGLEVVLGDFVSIRPEYRYYLSENRVAPSGAFLGPYLHLLDDTFGGGLMVGYQRLFKSKISLEAFAGPGLYGEGVSAWGGINIGFAF